MNSHPLPSNFNQNSDPRVSSSDGDPGLRKFANRLHQSMQRDTLIQNTTDSLREFLNTDRVVLYYFYQQWQGQVTFESLRHDKLSIFGLTSRETYFSDRHANLYQAGRVKAIGNVELESLNPSYKEFLKNIHVCASLVVPVLYSQTLWALLIAHHCQSDRYWIPSEIDVMKKAAKIIETAASNRK